MFKILITCPPMLGRLSEYESLFGQLGFNVTAPKVEQTLSVAQLKEILPNHDGWIIGDDPANEEVFQAGKNGSLKAAVKWGIGVDNIDFKACSKLGIPIANTPNMFGSEVADLAICYMLGLARDAFYIDRNVRNGIWVKPTGISTKDKTVGIMGLGDIGINIAKRAQAHEMNVIGWDPYTSKDTEGIRIYDWPKNIDKCDFLIFACALTDTTYHIFDKSILNLISNGIRIVNISRGDLIDEDALMDGLNSGKIASAALDVFKKEPLDSKHKIISHPKCILGSHNGSNTIDAVDRASKESIKLLNKMLRE